MTAKRIDHLGEHQIRFLDLQLLDAQFFLRLRNVGLVADDHCARFLDTLAVRGNAILRGEDPVAQSLHRVAKSGDLAVERLHAGAVLAEFDFLLRDLALMDRARLVALREIVADGAQFIGQRAVVAMRKMCVERAQVLHERLVAPRLRRLPLQ